MPIASNFNHLILSKDSIHLFPAIVISLLIIVGAWYINRILQKASDIFSLKHNIEQTLVKAIANLTYLFVYSLAARLFL